MTSEKNKYLFAGTIFIFASLLPLIAGSGYWLHIIIIAFYYAMLTSSWSLLAGQAGQFSFANAALSGLGAYTSALLVINLNIPPAVGIFAAVVAAGLMSLIIGFLCLRMKGPYLALFTIAFSEMLRIFLTAEYGWTRGNAGLIVPPLFESPDKTPYYYVILAILTASLIIMHMVGRSHIGLFFRAIREDEDAAASLAINVVKYKIIAFTLSGMFCGLAGAFYAHYICLLTPNMILLPEMGLIIAMAIIGGVESLAGAVIGAILLQIGVEYLRALGEWRLVFFGLILMLTIRYSSNGLIYPIYKRIWPPSPSPLPSGERIKERGS